MNQEIPAHSKNVEDHVANEEKLKNLGGKNIDEMSDDEAEAFLAERKKLKTANEALKNEDHGQALTENEKVDAYEEADQMNRDLDAAKAKAEDAASLKAEAVARAEQAQQDQMARQQEIDEATALTERIKSGNLGEAASDNLNMEGEESQESLGENSSKKPIEERYETPEGIYGMSLENLAALIKSEGFGEKLDSTDPDFKEKLKKFTDDTRSFKQVRVKLFDRVLSDEATEEEMKIVIDHVTEIGKYKTDLSGFQSDIPKAWYSNDRIAEAIAATSPKNKVWVEYVRKNYSNEELKKQFVKIDEDGEVRAYESK